MMPVSELKIPKKDLEMKLLAGIPIPIKNNIKCHTPKLKEIAIIGESMYDRYLSICLTTKDRFNLKDQEIDLQLFLSSMLSEVFKQQYNIEFKKSEFNDVYSLLLATTLLDQEIHSLLLEGLKFFLKCKVEIRVSENDLYLVAIQDDIETLITSDEFDYLQEVIRLQNCVEEVYKKEDNYANERARQIAENLRKAKEKINKIKNKNNEGLNLSDLISAYAANGNNVNIFSVWDMDIYQFNNQFQRMRMIEEYEIGIQSLLHGAKSENVKLEHYIGKIKK